MKTLTLGRCAVAAALLVAALLIAQVATASASDTYAMPQVVAQAATATPFRFLTPTPFVVSPTRPATTTTTTTPPRAGGFPLDLALPALAGGLTAIGGGTYLLRRKPTL